MNEPNDFTVNSLEKNGRISIPAYTFDVIDNIVIDIRCNIICNVIDGKYDGQGFEVCNIEVYEQDELYQHPTQYPEVKDDSLKQCVINRVIDGFYNYELLYKKLELFSK